MKACMHLLSFAGTVHHVGRKMAECGPVASEIGKVVGLWVYMTQNGGLSAIFPMVTVRFCCSGIFSKEVKPIWPPCPLSRCLGCLHVL